MSRPLKHLYYTAAILLALPLAASAEGYSRTEYVTVSQPRQQCWNEQVAVSGRNNDGALVGGIAGGIIGNQVGRGNGRVAATAVGAVTGAIVGERLSGGYNGVSYRTVQRCNTVYEQVQVPRTVTYVEPRVVYRPAPVVYVDRYPVYYERRHHHHHHNHD